MELAHLLRAPMRFFHERFDRYGSIFRSRLVYPVVFAVGAEANKSIMVTRRHEFSFGLGYQQISVNRVFANSIMVLDGEEHQRTRDILSPAVGKLAIQDTSQTVASIWRNVLRGSVAEQSDAYELAARGTFAVAANVLTGLQLGPDSEAFYPLFQDVMGGLMAATQVRFPGGRLDRALRSRDALIEMMRPRVLAAREAAPVGLLGQLAHAKDAEDNYLAPDRVTEHLLLLFWAGYDTTASSAAWILHTLAHRPDLQDSLRANLQTRIGGDPVTVENARTAERVGWFLCEIERMYPSALFFPRVTTEDIVLGGYDIPSGTPTFYSPYMSHRDPAAFENPNTFHPERWGPSGGARTAHLVGFGGGPRVCLGKAFAKLQLVIMINELLRDYALEPDPTARIKIQGVPVHHPKGSLFRLTARARSKATAQKAPVSSES